MAFPWQSMSYDDEPEVASILATFGAQRPEFDYYAEPDDVMRGLTLASPPDFFGLSAPACPPFDLSGKVGVAQDSSQMKVSAMPFGGLAATTIVVPKGAAPQQIAAAAESFLNQVDWAHVTKTNPAKGSVRATVRMANAGSCDLKATVFQAEGDQEAFALELRRMRGDGATFAMAFRLVAEGLAKQFPELRTMGDQLPELVPAPPAVALLDLEARREEDFAPLVELAVDGMHASQADAIAALAGLSCAAAGAALASAISSGALAHPGIPEAVKSAMPTPVGHTLQGSSFRGLHAHERLW